MIGTEPSSVKFEARSLENLRHRLLDLTARNRLLNFAHGRQGSIRIIDELPDELHRVLLSEEELRFRSIPDPTRQELMGAGYLELDPETGLDARIKKPTASEWARWLDFDTSYDLPEPNTAGGHQGKHTDKAIQTLMFPTEMEARLRTLRAKAETAIEETGANICYAAFGFLEWFESPDSDKPRHAPLLLVPVRIAKGRLDPANGTYNYTITYTGEDILPNLSLREKLRVDFGLALPDLDELTVPEGYFGAVQQIVEKPRPRWRVRRWVTVTLLNFSKLLMYLDLDPERWPSGRPITSHPIVSRFFANVVDEGGSAGFVDEYPIDDIKDVHDLCPLVDDADSSQHSALLDAVQGKNLVIEGPPGTGKSQTITNLIAAALARGKRVLFVAVKLAALEVVKRRLDLAGLGDFCLELHSHKTQKRKILDDVTTRLGNQTTYRLPEQIDADILRYESLKGELRRYAELINSRWKQTGISIHAILMAATRYREEAGIDPGSLHPDAFDGEIFTVDFQLQSLDTVRIFADVYGLIAKQLGEGEDLRNHPWYGVGNRDLQLFDKERVCASLSRWQEALDGLARTMLAASTLLDLDQAGVPPEMTGILSLKRDLGKIPVLQGDEFLSALPHLRKDNVTVVVRHLALFREIRENQQALAEDLRPEYLNDPEAHSQLRAAHAQLKQLGAVRDSDLHTLAKQLKRIERLQAELADLGKPMAEVAISLGHTFTDVVKFNAAGLREFCGLVELVCGLRPTLFTLRSEWFDDDAMDDLLPTLKTQVGALHASRLGLSRYFALDRLPAPEDLRTVRMHLRNGGLFRWLDGEWRASRRALYGLAAKPKMALRDLANSLDALLDYATDKQALEKDARYKAVLGVHFNGMDTPVADLAELREWYRSVRLRYGVGFGPKVPLGDAVLGMHANVAKGIQSLAQQGILARVDEVLTELAVLKSALCDYAAIQSDIAALVGAQGPLSNLQGLLALNLAVCQRQLTDPGASVSTLESVVSRLQTLESLLEAWSATAVDRHWFGQVDLLVAPEQIDAATVAAAERTLTLAGVIEEGIECDNLRDAIHRNPSSAMFASLRQLDERLTNAWHAHIEQRDQFALVTELSFDAWQRRAGGTLDGLVARNQAALDNADWLSNWLDYVRVRHQAEAIGFGRLAASLEHGALAPNTIDAGYKLAVNDLLARQILKEIPTLARFSGNAHMALQKQFRQYDERLKKLQRERIAWRIAQNSVPSGSFGGRVANYTELALLRHECGKKKRHIPLRQLVLRAGNALAALKPCFMMGPMSVAQYLAPGQIAFDLVVMDEASQMKPEDALGAIARGAQLVVVGDPKQLPPTSFFDKMIGDDEEDSVAIEDSESILDAAIPMFDARRLRWHYRSQHESLIAFSNHAFYDGGLVVFPVPYAESADFGVKFVRVPRGRFVNRRNVEEARVIAMAVQRHLLHRPGESIGVVAMSADQRDQIERAVEDVAKDDPLFQEAVEQNLLLDEPLFIKNLENVQGDERDVIFISCTYGPEEIAGRVFQRFGPINSDVGWRRLNVLFTRSKKRMHVFSSMGSEDILVSERSKRGVTAFKDFLAFAETGHLHRAVNSGRAPDSDFEVAVMSTLSEAGFECVSQVGVAGFFIDIAVRDPGDPGRYLMGIECDGASYHSAKSVRDRDRLRQEVLERLGWRIRRIWSTDWYRNPQAELGPIIRELNGWRTEVAVNEPQLPETAESQQIVESELTEEIAADATMSEELSLREMLVRFDREVIRTQLPETPENQRLLRPAMLEALLEFMPVTKKEFVEAIPLYLRQVTFPQEGKYLDAILRMIEETET